MGFELADELSIEIKDEPGALAQVLSVVSGAGVDVRAFCGYAMAGAGNVMVVPRDATKAKAALKKAGYRSITTGKVVVGQTRDKRGAAAKIAEAARERGINLEYSYATGLGKGQGLIVLNAGKDNRRLAKALGSL